MSTFKASGANSNSGHPEVPAHGNYPNHMRTPSMSTIESTVTRLLVATKQLLESLTQWARGEASEQDVSDVYVNLGNEFNVACRAFLNAGVEVNDLGDVPQALRVILEKALSEDASQENLDRYLPSIREVIVNLLRQLKQKQGTIRAQHSRNAAPRVNSNPNANMNTNILPKYVSRTDSNSGNTVPQHAPRKSSYTKLPHNGGQQQIQNNSQDGLVAVPPHKQRSESRVTDADNIIYESEVSSSTNGTRRRSPASPRKDNALLALQKGEALERRASRRFSAYQFAKLANGTTNSSSKESLVPELPPLPSSVRSSMLPTKASHESTPPDIVSSTTMGDEADYNLSPSIRNSKTMSTSIANNNMPDTGGDKIDSSETEFSIYLQIADKVKRTIIKREDLTIPALRLLFIDKFAYNPGAENFPEIYIQDPKSGVRYELDESAFNEIQLGSVLSLNIDSEDDMKKYITDSMAKLTDQVSVLSEKLDQHSDSIQKIQGFQVADRITSNSVNESTTVSPVIEPTINRNRPISSIDLKSIDELRRGIAVVRQLSTSSFEGLKSQLKELVAKAQILNTSSSLPVVNGTTRAFMESCHKKLSVESDTLLTNVDDLQDIIEALRKDVAQRGVRHSAKQLESVYKELALAKHELEKMESYITKEKPGWKKIWERELDTICEEQQFFKLQEELVADLQDDLKKAQETFNLVEMCSNEQVKSSGSIRKLNPIIPMPAEGISHAKDAVLTEVQALQPNHDRRVEAIERAEKLRKKELEMRGQGEFADELEEFVVENKLKKSGGIEETERRRLLREQKVKEESLKSEAEAKELRRLERQKKREQARREAEEQTIKDDIEASKDDIESLKSDDNNYNDDSIERSNNEIDKSNDDIFESPDEGPSP